MLELIKRCRYCRREMNVSAREHTENPFCGRCLKERLRRAAAAIGPVRWEQDGHYLVATPVHQTAQ